jgi:hypothetical protein
MAVGDGVTLLLQVSPFCRAGSTGIVKLSSLDYNDRQYVRIHDKPIRDLKCCPDGYGAYF